GTLGKAGDLGEALVARRGELRGAAGRQRELVLRVARTPADAQVLHRLQEGGRARDTRQRATQAGKDLVRRELPGLRRGEGDVDATGVDGVGAPAAAAVDSA